MAMTRFTAKTDHDEEGRLTIEQGVQRDKVGPEGQYDHGERGGDELDDDMSVP